MVFRRTKQGGRTKQNWSDRSIMYHFAELIMLSDRKMEFSIPVERTTHFWLYVWNTKPKHILHQEKETRSTDFWWLSTRASRSARLTPRLVSGYYTPSRVMSRRFYKIKIKICSLSIKLWKYPFSGRAGMRPGDQTLEVKIFSESWNKNIFEEGEISNKNIHPCPLWLHHCWQ